MPNEADRDRTARPLEQDGEVHAVDSVPEPDVGDSDAAVEADLICDDRTPVWKRDAVSGARRFVRPIALALLAFVIVVEAYVASRPPSRLSDSAHNWAIVVIVAAALAMVGIILG